MSSLVAYLGPTANLHRLLLDVPRGLLHQGRREAQDQHEAPISYGFGWYAEDGRPAVYRRNRAVQQDTNAEDLSRSLASDLWLAGSGPVDTAHTGRFATFELMRDDELLFMSSAWAQGYRSQLRPAIRDFLPPEAEHGIIDGSVGEHLFALLRHLLASETETTVPEALCEVLDLTHDWMGDLGGSFDLLASDGSQLCAGRLTVNCSPPPLFYTTDDDTFPEAQVMASEPLTETDFWHPLPEDSILVLDPGRPPELMSLREPDED